jgi:hypothetical protein
LHLSDDLARRFKRTIAGRQRSRFVQRLLEEGLPPQELREDDRPIRPRWPSKRTRSFVRKWRIGRMRPSSTG